MVCSAGQSEQNAKQRLTEQETLASSAFAVFLSFASSNISLLLSTQAGSLLEHCCSLSLCYLSAETGYRLINTEILFALFYS